MRSSAITISETERKIGVGAGARFTAAFVSDLHNYPNGPVIETIRTCSPDVVLVGGDFIQSRTDTESGLAFLAAAASEWPVFCSSGKEHDFDKDLIQEIENTGAVFLRNQSVVFKGANIGGLNTLPLMGKSAPERLRLIGKNRAWLEEYSRLPGYKILLCHHPEYYELFVRDYPIDLILSGHAHGGHIRFFNRGLWAPGQGWFPQYTSGLYDGRLLVGRGIGNSYPIPRFFNKPEILKIGIGP